MQSTRSFPLLMLLIALAAAWASAQTAGGKAGTKNDPVKLEWTNLEKAVAKAAGEKKPILLDVYTDWCGWCKKMDKEVFVDPEVAAVLTSRFALAKVNGESRDEITFKGQKTDGVGIARGFGVKGYPSIIFLDDSADMLTMIPGYLDAGQFLPVVTYIGNGIYRDMEWEQYLAQFNRTKNKASGSK